MALTDILERIEKELKASLDKLEKDFETRKTDLDSAHGEAKKKIDEEMHQKIDTNSKKIKDKAENLAEREGKNQLLTAKRELIDETLDKAIEQLAKSDKYEELITNLLKKTDLKEAVVVPAKGKENETKKAIKASGKDYFLSDKSSAIKGGFILKTDKVEIDNAFETLIKEQMRDNLEIKIHKELF